MSELRADQLEKIRQQFESSPYPRTPLDKSPKDDVDLLYIHNLVTAFYLKNQTIAATPSCTVLDAGCGSGYKSLVLAEANPGARIIGVDLSKESVKLARQRLQHHGFDQAEFYALSIQDIGQLGMKFDYINCDDVLYLLPDPLVGLKAMKSVLKPGGIIRANLHSALQRVFYYRAQKVFHLMGLMDKNPGELEIALARGFIHSLKDEVLIKAKTWFTSEVQTKDESVLMNYLFQGDRGFTIPDLFSLLKAANLDLISMVRWQHWDLYRLFPNFPQLSANLKIKLSALAIPDQLHLVELLHPTQRLLDFWCGHPEIKPYQDISQWSIADWRNCQVHLHPQLNNAQVQQALINAIQSQQSLQITQFITIPVTQAIEIESAIAACLLPLWNQPQTFQALFERFLTLHPCDPVTLEPVSDQQAFEQLQVLLTRLNDLLYLLLEKTV